MALLQTCIVPVPFSCVSAFRHGMRPGIIHVVGTSRFGKGSIVF
jgi:hypothetical protein